MRRAPQILVLLLTLCAAGHAQFHLMTGANHGELRWRTLATAHFRVHYHQGLDSLAREAASVAEQVYPTVTAQLGVEPRGRTELAITDRDAIVNGFAFKNRIAIWVDQNDYVRHWSQRREWLHLVIAHEFQHTVAFAALRDWRGGWGLMLSGTPSWWLEGLAEYYTETWNTLRSDRKLRAEVLDRRLKQSDPHDAGFAKVLYLAWRDGDSTLVKITRWRHKRLRIHQFEDAFQAVTGQSLSAFEEEWTRVVNGIYNAEYAAGEPLDEVGRRIRLPLESVTWLALAPDSSAWLAVGKDSLAQGDLALYRIACDSTRRVDPLVGGLLAGRAALAADGKRVVFDRQERDRHGSVVVNLWEKELPDGRLRRLTRDGRSQDPALAPDGTLAWIRCGGGRSRVMRQAPGQAEEEWWDPGKGWELFHPSFSPDGRRLALATHDPGSCQRVTLLEGDGRWKHLPPAAEDERDPVWLRDSLLVTTAFTDFRANLLARTPAGGSRPISGSGEGVWSLGTGASMLVALGLDSARISRPLLVDPDRHAGGSAIQLQPRFRAWRERRPDLPLPDWDPGRVADVLEDRRYRPWELRPLSALLLPLPESPVGMLMLADPLFKNTLLVSAGAVEREPMALVQLENRQLDWTLQVKGAWQSEFGLGLVESDLTTWRASSLELGARRAWSLPGRPYENLVLSLGARIEKLEWLDEVEDEVATPFRPQDAEAGRLGLSLAWQGTPPGRHSGEWPLWSHGVALRGAAARPWLHGDEDVDSWGAEAYRLQPLFHPSAKLFLQARLDGLSGSRQTWRTLGFSRDPLLLPPGGGMAAALPGGPVSQLRGLEEALAGDRVFQATSELRFSLGRPPLVDVLGLRNARVVIAPFADFGHVADRRRQPAASREARWLWTSGVEAQLGFQVEGALLLTTGLGVGGEDLDWLRSGHKRNGFWRLAASTPF